MTKRLLKAAIVSGLLLTLVAARITTGAGQSGVQATGLRAPASTSTKTSRPQARPHDAGSSCTNNPTLLNISSGQFSGFTSPTSITLTVPAGGLDYVQNNNRVYVEIFDNSGRSALLTPSSAATVNSDGSYSGTALLPYGGVSGGADTIVVAANGPKCQSALFTIQPTIQVSPKLGTTFSFSGVGFHPNSVLTITFKDSAGTVTTVDLGGQLSTDALGQATILGAHIPSSAQQGSGTVTIADSQQGSATASFTFGPDPTPVPIPSDTPRPPVVWTNTPIPLPTFTPGPSPTLGTPVNTSTPVAGAPTSTPINASLPTYTPISTFTGSAATVTPFPSSTFPPTRTPIRSRATPTPTKGSLGGSTQAAGAFSNGGFDKGLNSWIVSGGTGVTVQSGVRHASHYAVLINAPAKQALSLEQPFAYNGSSQSVTFYYLNLAQESTATLLDNGRVVVGRRLLPSKGNSFLPGVLTLPSTLQTKDTLTILITAKKGKTYIAEVNLSKLAQGFR